MLEVTSNISGRDMNIEFTCNVYKVHHGFCLHCQDQDMMNDENVVQALIELVADEVLYAPTPLPSHLTARYNHQIPPKIPKVKDALLHKLRRAISQAAPRAWG